MRSISSTKLSRIGELALLEQIKKNFGKKIGDVPVGIGDDAAVLRSRDEYLLVTTDMMVEGIHFDLRFVTPYQIGFKLVSVNVSDIYAMGGSPSYILLNIAVSGHMSQKFFDAFFAGVKGAIDLYRIRLIGGDLSSAGQEMSVAATLVGYTKKYIKRSGATVGDKIYVTGNLGDSACGLKLLSKIKRPLFMEYGRTAQSVRLPVRLRAKTAGKSGIRSFNFRLSKLGLSWKTIEPLVRRHLMPVARRSEIISRVASSMIDVSDGLLIDLWRLCDESRVGARIYERDIPMSPELKEAATGLRLNSLELALTGGEDYELLFTAPSNKSVKAIYIGDIIKSERVVVDGEGRERSFSAEGYRHFSV